MRPPTTPTPPTDAPMDGGFPDQVPGGRQAGPGPSGVADPREPADPTEPADHTEPVDQPEPADQPERREQPEQPEGPEQTEPSEDPEIVGATDRSDPQDDGGPTSGEATSDARQVPEDGPAGFRTYPPRPTDSSEDREHGDGDGPDRTAAAPSRPGRGVPAIDPRIHQRRLAIARLEGRRRLRVLLGVVGLVILVLLAWALLHTGLFAARVVTVTGVHPHTSDAAIEQAAGLGGHPPLIDVDPAATAARVGSLPYIASARVIRHWPDGVTVSVTERVPVAVMAGPGPSWSVLDGSGRTLQVLTTPPPGVPVLVVHTTAGVVHPSPVGGSLPASATPALTVSRTLPPAFSAQVVSVSAAPDGTIGLALNSGVTVLFGTATELGAKYEDIAAIIAHGSLPRAGVIDVSVPQSPTVGS